MSGMLQDLRLAWRGLRRSPGFTVVAVLTVALGIGANTAVFSIVDALLLRPFPLPDVERLVAVEEVAAEAPDSYLGTAPANYVDWQAAQQTMTHLAASEWWDVNLSGIGEPRRAAGHFVSAGFFEGLGVEVALGRSFLPAEADPGASHVVILSYSFWRREYGAEPGVIGRVVRLDGIPHTVVGVGPKGFDFPMGTDVWAPLVLGEAATRRDSRYLRVFGRLADGRSSEEAESELKVVAARLAEEYPSTNEGYGVRVRPLATAVIDEGTGPFLALWQGAAAFVLLIACTNLANLLLTRGAARRKEIALRLAMGASRWRVVRQLGAESAMVAALGSAVALPVTWLALGEFRRSMPPEIQRFVYGWSDIDVDGRVLAFMVGAAVVAMALFGILPALRASRTSLTDSLKEGGRSVDATGGSSKSRGLLVASEIALALALLVAAGLSVQGAVRLLQGDRGYRGDGLMTFRVTLSERQFDSAGQRRQFHEALLERLDTLAGVSEAGAANVIPASNADWTRSIAFDDRPSDRASERPTAKYRSVTPGYLETMGVPLLQGRTLGPADIAGAQRVAVVSRNMAERFWPGQDPIGRRFRPVVRDEEEWITVVGVVGDVLHHWFDQDRRPTYYLPFAQSPPHEMTYVVRPMAGDPTAVMPEVRAALAGIDPDQALHSAMTMTEVERHNTIGLRYVALVMALFAGIALVLAAVGIYGVLAHVVGQRRHEIGVRLALGASRPDVMRLTLGYTLRHTLIGLLVGLLLAAGIGRLMATALYGVVSVEAWIFAAIAAGLLAVSLVAGYVPTRQALKVDPLAALRTE